LRVLDHDAWFIATPSEGDIAAEVAFRLATNPDSSRMSGFAKQRPRLDRLTLSPGHPVTRRLESGDICK